MKQTIGLMAVIRNEKDRLKKFLNYYVPYVDEVVICDQESDDGTFQALETYRTEFYQKHDLNYNFIVTIDNNWGYCEPSKQKVADMLNTDWLLYLDPDEYLPKEFLEIMHEICDTDEVDGFAFPRDNIFDIQVFNDNVPIEPKWLTIQHPAKDIQLKLTRKSVSIFPKELHHRVRIFRPDGSKHIKNLPYHIEHRKSFTEQWSDNKRYAQVNKR